MWGEMWGRMWGEMWGQSDTLSSGLACLRNHPVTACPASWCATRVRSSSDSTLLFRSRPPITRSAAAWKSEISTASLFARAATSAPSLQTFATSAPEKPGVSEASVFETSSMSSASLSFERWTRKISARLREGEARGREGEGGR